MKHIPRTKELEKFIHILNSNKSEFVYLRGRRRIGKSWLLGELRKSVSNCFLFAGLKDASSEFTLRAFAENWDEFSQTSNLSELRKEILSWSRIFEQISEYIERSSEKTTIILDEVQWLAKQGNGFISTLKNAWVEWEKLAKVNIIVCGSSNKFFSDHVGGEEKILRGLQTAASIWLLPLTFHQVRHHCLPQWNIYEVAVVYMMVGGIPYYLQRLEPDLGFIYGINKAFFSAERNLLEEIDEILSLEFNAQGRESVKKILRVIGQEGSAQKNINLATGMQAPSISKIVDQLVKYQILHPKFPLFRKKEKYESLPKYFMKDFFLNFYFQLLAPLEKQIQTNEKGLLFPYQVKLSDVGYYIPNFTGKAFELLLRQVLEYGRFSPTILHDKLQLHSPDFEVGDYWDKNTQIDLIVSSKSDRLCRIIECKWSNNFSKIWKEELINKPFPLPQGMTRQNILICAFPPTGEIKKELRGLKVLGLEDLLE